MTIIMRTTLAHPVYGCAGPGCSITVDDDTGKALIAGRYADLAPQARESTSMRTPEKAVHEPASRKSR